MNQSHHHPRETGGTSRLLLASVAVIAAVVAIVCVALVVLLVLRNTNKPQTHTYSSCSTGSCRVYQGFFASTMNPKVNPCDDYYKYTCGTWLSMHAANEYVLGYARRELTKEIEGTLQSMKNLKRGPKPIHNAALFMKACLSITNASHMDSVREVLARGNITWPHPNSKPDFLNALFYMSLTVQRNVFFDIRFVHGDSGLWQLYLTFSESAQRLHTGFLRQIKTRHLADHLRETYRAFGNLNQTRLKEMLQRYADTEPLFEQFSKSEPIRLQLTSATRFLEYFPSVPAKRWNDVFLRHENVSMNKLGGLMINTPNDIRAVSKLHQTHGEDFVNELVEALAVQSLIVLTDFALLSSFYQDSQLALRHIRRKCFDITYHMFGYAINDLYHSKTQTGEHFVRTLADKLRKSSPGVLMGNASEDSDHPPAKTNHLDTALLTLDWSRPNRYTALYATQPQLTDNPLKNYVLISAYLKSLPENSERKSAIVERTAKVLPMFWDFRPTIDYFRYPFYAPDASLGVLYAGIGTRLAASLYYDYVERHNVSYQDAIYEENLNCINPKNKREPKDLVGAVASVPLAWHVFQEALAGNGSEGRLATAVPPADPRQLFFLFFCYLQCGTERGEQVCNEPLRHSRDFARVYECAPKSKMNPDRKCVMSV